MTLVDEKLFFSATDDVRGWDLRALVLDGCGDSVVARLVAKEGEGPQSSAQIPHGSAV